MTGRLPILLLLLAVLATPGAGSHAAVRVTLFAAASTAPAIQEIAAEYKDETGVAITPVFAASGALARQIDSGAPADIFLSADTDWMDWLIRRGRIDRRLVKTLLSNCLVLIQPPARTPPNADADKTPPLAFDRTLLKRLGKGRLALADPAFAPLGAYARAALRGQGMWHRLQNRLALQPDARATLALVGRGEAAAGIVYRSDAQGAASVRIAAAIPESLHPGITYPVAPVGGQVGRTVTRFLEYLRSSDARSIFEDHGFIRPKDACSD